MNKTAFKKFLTVLLVLMLAMSMFLLAACDKDDIPAENEEPEETETFTAKPTFTNGNFATLSSSSETVTYPSAPSGFTKGGASSTQISPSDATAAFPAADKSTSGVISLDQTAYDANYTNWDSLARFDARTTTDANYDSDKNVLMIYNREATYLNYTSASFSIAKDTDYILTVDVKTSGIAGNSKGSLTQQAGARVYLYGTAALYGEFVGIKDTEWSTYKFYIQGSPSAAKTLYLMLALGKGDSSSVNTSEFLTSGYAFFDNVTLTAIKASDTDTYESAVEGAKVKKVTAVVPNAEFDFVSGSSPALYTKLGVSTTSLYNRVNVSTEYFNADYATYGFESADANPGKPAASTGDNVYMIKNSVKSALGYRTTNPLYFSRGRAYQISLWVKTVGIDGKASLILSEGTTSTTDDLKVADIDTAGEWKKYSFYVYSNQNVASQFYFQFWLGTGGAADTDTHASGLAFFDSLSITELDVTATTSFDDAVTAASATDTSFTKKDFTTSAAENLMTNGYLSNGISGWDTVYDEGSTEVYNGINIANVKKAIVVAGDSITVGDQTFDDPETSYNIFGGNVLAVYAPTPVTYKLDYSFNTMTLQPFTAYRFGIWVKTRNVQSTASLGVTLTSGDTTLATFTGLNSEGATTDVNGYQEAVCYIYTDAEPHDIKFSVTFGSGTKWTSTTLFDGEAYIANASLTESTYSSFSSASSSSAKSYNFNTSSSGSFTNGAFNNYDYNLIEGLTDGGLVDSDDDEIPDSLSKNFGTPTGWSISSSSIAQTYYGIVDVERDGSTVASDNLVANLQTKTGLVDASDFTNLFFNPTAATPNNLLSYAGGSKALMVAAGNSNGVEKEFLHYGYTSSGFSLSANTYYKISVLAKTLDVSKASIYLSIDNANDNDVSFTDISTTGASDTNGWKRYTFLVNVGTSSLSSVKLGLYLGANDSPAANVGGNAIGGVVFFDSVTKEAIDKDTFDAAYTDSDIEATKKITFATDSFGISESNKHESASYLSPSSWTGSNKSAAGVTTDTNAGVLGLGSYNFTGMTDEAALRANLTAHSGDNLLVINNKIAAAYSFVSGNKSLSKATFTRISVWAKTYNVPEGQNAYIKLNIPNKYNTNEENVFYFNNTEYTQYTFYVATDANNSLSSVTVELGLGTLIGDTANYATGYAIFDDVEIATLSDMTADTFAALTPSATLKTYLDKNDTNIDANEKPEEDDEPEDPNTGINNNSQFWLLLSSLFLGAVLIAVLIVFAVKKYTPKRKVTIQKASDAKEKENGYNDLND